MNMIPQEEINNIRSSVNIVDVVSDYIPLTQKGKNYFGVCPFHDDHAPSMSVSTEKQIYTCFSCGATGNVFKFIMDYEHMNFLEAVKLIATKAGINVNIKNIKKRNNDSPLYEIYETSTKFYQNNINTEKGKLAKQYLLNRSLNEEIIKEFEIGLALKERDILTKLLTKKGYDDKTLLKSGLIVKNDYGYNDIYYDRIMFPLYDLFGKVIGFSGRRYDDGKDFKYINTKETEIFKKGEILYNYHRAKDEARKMDQIIIMEGFMDVIRAYSVGIKNTVATMGTAVTKEQASIIKRMAREVILCFDGDEAGAKATLACSNELIKIGVMPKIVRLEKDMDPDDYIKQNGVDAFKSKINNPINIMDFKLDYLKHNKDLTSSVDMASYVNDIIKELNTIDDDILREVTLKKISVESNLDIDFLRSKTMNHQSIEQTQAVLNKPVIKYNKYEKAEQNLIFYMLNSPEVIKMYNKKITYMPTLRYRNLARQISYYYKQYGSINIADFISYLEDETEMLKTISEIMNLDLKDTYKVDEINDYINAIYEFNNKFAASRLTEKMKQETDPIKKATIGSEILELRKRRDNSD